MINTENIQNLSHSSHAFWRNVVDSFCGNIDIATEKQLKNLIFKHLIEAKKQYRFDKKADMPSLAKQRNKNVCKPLSKPTMVIFTSKIKAEKFSSERIKDDSINLNKLS